MLVPQVAKNFWQRSVAGLSFLWALANFTASLVNLFFAFTIPLPLYSKVSAVYMPVLELTILLQFLLFHKLLLRRKLLFLVVCLLLWGTIVELELCLPYPATDDLEWIAIVLWSVETFPQIVLNAQLRNTRGQSTLSVLITICGKTTDFLSTYALSMPLKYVIMAYFSSSMGLTNGWQVRPHTHTHGYKHTTFPRAFQMVFCCFTLCAVGIPVHSCSGMDGKCGWRKDAAHVMAPVSSSMVERQRQKLLPN